MRMNEAKKLQQRVAMAYRKPAPSSSEEPPYPHRPAPDPGHAGPRHIDPSLTGIDRSGWDKDKLVPYLLIAGGLLVLMLALSLRLDAGLLLLTVCLGAGAIAAGLYIYARKLEAAVTHKSLYDMPGHELPRHQQRLGAPLPHVAMLSPGSIHDAFGDITLSRSLDGTIVSANRVFREMTGHFRPEGRTCEELRVRFRPSGVEHCYDVEFATLAGSRIFFWRDVVMRDPVFGEPIIQSVARDVTMERLDVARREQALLTAEEENDRKSRLIATVSHEIRTPLSGLLGMGHLLAGTRLSPEQSNYLDGIRQSGSALAQLVEDLLDFSTISAGRFRLHPRAEAIRPLIENTVEMLASRAHAKGIEIGSTMSADLPDVLTFDPARFRQVLYNVIGNAVKFTETGGVLVSATLEDSTLVLKVTDSGPGMNEGEMQRIFGEFEQGNLSRLREGGVGLGLAISARIMAETGGSLSVESRMDQGTTFIVRLPVAMDNAPLRRRRELAGARILLLAPQGPAAAALSRTIGELGADWVMEADLDAARQAIATGAPFSAIIVDHRLDAGFTELLSPEAKLAGVKRIFLVNPESRPARMSGASYDSWLIRPLREQSLIDVLTGKLKGLEPRSATNDDFPILPATPAEDRQSLEIVRKHPASLSILLGEDDPVNAMISQALLERSGHRVRLAETFATLASALASGDVDLIVTDFSMPGGTCEQFIVALRRREAAVGGARMPLIVLTGDATDETRRNLLAVGADLVLVKPAGPKILAGAIEHLAGATARSV